MNYSIETDPKSSGTISRVFKLRGTKRMGQCVSDNCKNDINERLLTLRFEDGSIEKIPLAKLDAIDPNNAADFLSRNPSVM